MQRPKPLKLLLSCRDRNGAYQIVPLVREARRNGLAAVDVVADGAALEVLNRNKISFKKANLKEIRHGDSKAQKKAELRASVLLKTYAPDAVIVSSSGPHAGIDEALVAANGPKSSFVLQDFWGDVNCILRAHAGHYLVLDRSAAAATKKRVRARMIESWMPKYDAYASTDWIAEGRRLRRERGIDPAAAVVSFFPQALWDVPGYEELVLAVVNTVARMDGTPKLNLRARRKDIPGKVRRALERARARGVECRVNRYGEAEDAIASSDIVVSAYSTCCYDAIVMSARSARPLNTPIYFMTEPVRNHYRESTKLDHVPPVDAGMALFARSSDELMQQLRAGLDRKRREGLWRRARAQLPPPDNVARRILDTVIQSIGRTGTGRRTTA